ncbi:MAG: M50 family metallopeptidase [Melioribacteraceae bacterium]|nr:M50 family metallopeptidase [Melioribacteraceae bacterium]
MRLTRKQKQITEIIILFIITFIAFLLWDTLFIYPIKLLVVLFHEISHGLAAVLSGGKVVALDVGLDLSGVCTIEGGNSFFIASSGYLGSFIFGMILFYSSYNKNFGQWILPIIAVVLIIFTINSSTNAALPFALMGVILIIFLIKYFAPSKVSDFVLKSIGLISCIYVLIDIKEDILDTSYSYSDASILAQLTGISELIWGLLWLSLSIVGIFFLLKLAYKKGI